MDKSKNLDSRTVGRLDGRIDRQADRHNLRQKKNVKTTFEQNSNNYIIGHMYFERND